MNSFLLKRTNMWFTTGMCFVNGDRAILEDGSEYMCTIWCNLEDINDVIGNPNFRLEAA